MHRVRRLPFGRRQVSTRRTPISNATLGAINRDAFGGRVTLECDGHRLVREVKSSRGMHNSMDMRTLHFGLSGFDCEFDVRVDWPDGTSVTFAYTEVTDGRYHDVTYPDSIATTD